MLAELGLKLEVFGEHREFTRAWISTPKSKLVFPFQ
jgi:hypothetical protein